MSDGSNETEMEQEYVQMKICPRNEILADGSVGTRVMLMLRGGVWPVTGRERMTWKYDDHCCGCCVK